MLINRHKKVKKLPTQQLPVKKHFLFDFQLEVYPLISFLTSAAPLKTIICIISQKNIEINFDLNEMSRFGVLICAIVESINSKRERSQ